jgi:hypothetical protein
MQFSFFVCLCLLGLSSMPAPASPVKASFKPQTIDGAISIGYGLAIGDMNGDGKQDILLADAKEFVWYQNPTWEKRTFAKLNGIRDNVCLTTEDIDGDGKVEIAVGANWNPAETTDAKSSGSVHYLIRPTTEHGLWTPVDLPHEPTVHRMRWMKLQNRWALLVLPLHGRGNKNGAGENGVKIQAYFPPKNPSDTSAWEIKTLDDSLHVTHNLDRLPDDAKTMVVGAKEGVWLWLGETGTLVKPTDAAKSPLPVNPFPGIGEIRWFKQGKKTSLPNLAAIEPFHGNALAMYTRTENGWERSVIDNQLAQGHALGCGDFLSSGADQIVAGWREPNAKKEFGIKLYAANADGTWAAHWVDQNKMACEDLKVADLNDDGKPDIIAAGRVTKNVVIYWNESGK